jgi:hypothetical protein
VPEVGWGVRDVAARAWDGDFVFGVRWARRAGQWTGEDGGQDSRHSRWVVARRRHPAESRSWHRNRNKDRDSAWAVVPCGLAWPGLSRRCGPACLQWVDRHCLLLSPPVSLHHCCRRHHCWCCAPVARRAVACQNSPVPPAQCSLAGELERGHVFDPGGGEHLVTAPGMLCPSRVGGSCSALCMLLSPCPRQPVCCMCGHGLILVPLPQAAPCMEMCAFVDRSPCLLAMLWYVRTAQRSRA